MYRREIVSTYFVAENQEEYENNVKTIVSYTEQLNKTLSEEFFNTYTFIESSTAKLIEELGLTQQYKKYKKNKNKSKSKTSEFKFMTMFINDEIYQYNQNEVDFNSFIDQSVRNARNDIVHKFYQGKKDEIINQIINNNVNVEVRLKDTYDNFLLNIDALLQLAYVHACIIMKISKNEGTNSA
ncbi:hypothetical protein GNF86_17920 [Clostridium perfringens]